MIVRPKPNFINILSAIKGSIAKRIALRSLMVMLLASVIVLVETMHPSYFSKVSATPFTLLGLSLSIFMSFRNNACYDRWYEGRKAWGDVMVAIRSMIRETAIIKDADTRNAILSDLCGFAHGLKAKLRQENERAASGRWLDPIPNDNAPDFSGSILLQVGQQCSALSESGAINEWRYTNGQSSGPPDPGTGRLRTDQTHAAAVCLYVVAAPHQLPFLLLAALRHGRTPGLDDTDFHRDCELHLFWPGCDWR